MEQVLRRHETKVTCSDLFASAGEAVAGMDTKEVDMVMIKGVKCQAWPCRWVGLIGF
jgi:predicted regulator of Ras-like GTPase activity (Roadblock/LC7/MglB family)